MHSRAPARRPGPTCSVTLPLGASTLHLHAMRFRRFLGGSPGDPAPPPPPPPPAEDDDDGGDDELPEQGDEDTDLDLQWRSRAADVIPGGASTGSKRPEALYGMDAESGPTHFVRAAGCRVTTPGGGTYIDCSMALGAVTLGYGDEMVTQSVIAAAASGNVCGLSHVSEVEIAERLCDVVPCAEQVRFLKTGAEAVAAAVRIARTYTARDKVVGSGYFGWLDWWTEATGVPPGAHADFTGVPFDDVAALERACGAAGDQLAAVVLEPVIERLPSTEWIAAARSICDRTGAVLIFDEIKTGFRLKTGGFQEHAGVEPDVATLGKAMANGFPIAAVVGRAAVMEAAKSTWISSTLAGETVGLAATNAVLDWHERADVADFLWTAGEEMKNAIARAITASGIDGVTVEGIAPMWLIRFDDPAVESRFLARSLAHGVLFKRGAYNFSSLAHDEDAIGRIEGAASNAFVDLVEEGEA